MLNCMRFTILLIMNKIVIPKDEEKRGEYMNNTTFSIYGDCVSHDIAIKGGRPSGRIYFFSSCIF